MSPSSSIDQNAMKKVPYASVVGHLTYFITITWPNLSYSMGHCVQFMSNLDPHHWSVVKIIFHYLQFTQAIRLTYSSYNFWLQGYINADKVNDVNTQKSTYGYIFLFKDGAISWQCCKQMTMILSSIENKYITI